MPIDPLDPGDTPFSGASPGDALDKINELVHAVNDLQAKRSSPVTATKAEMDAMLEQSQDAPPYAVPQHWLDYVNSLRHALMQTTTKLEADARAVVEAPPAEALLGRDALELKPPG